MGRQGEMPEVIDAQLQLEPVFGRLAPTSSTDGQTVTMNGSPNLPLT
jgi:hypothetical protein